MKNLHLSTAIGVGMCVTLLAIVAAAVGAAEPAAQASDRPAGVAPIAKIPVIVDTDIGDDIDDTWALVMLLKSPQFDLKLVTTTCGKAEYRAKLVAKLLTVAKRTDVAVGLGAGYKAAGTGEHQGAWVKDYNLAGYPGKVQTDGVGALIAAIDAAPQPITLISLGPSDTVAAALERKPDIAAKAFFVGMQGSLRKGYGGSDKAAAEYNVAANIAAAKKVLGAPWRTTTITPLDTCGLVNLSGRRFQTLCESNDELVKALLENYRIWKKTDKVSESTILFDTVAVYLAYPEPKSLLVMEELPIAVTDKGFTAIDPAGAKMSVATAWKDLDGYRDLLVEVLLSNERQKR